MIRSPNLIEIINSCTAKLSSTDDIEATVLSLSTRGVAYGKLGRIVEAIQDLERVTLINPNDGNTFGNLAFAYIKVERWKDVRNYL